MTTASEQVGRSARQRAPRSAHAAWEAAPDRVDAIATLEHQAETRTPELVPVRYGRMARSPFAFFRGAAAIMAADLAATPVTGWVRSCAATPPGELRRLRRTRSHPRLRSQRLRRDATRAVGVGPQAPGGEPRGGGARSGFDATAQRDVVQTGVRAYREAIRGFAAMRTLDVWYARVDVERQVADWGAAPGRRPPQELGRAVAKARRKNSLRALAKLTYRVDGAPRIVSDPPLIVPVEELLGAEDDGAGPRAAGGSPPRLSPVAASRPPRAARRATSRSTWHQGRRRRQRGTRAWIVLMLGRDDADPLFLQVKEAQPSVLEPFASAARSRNHGQRVVRASG